MGLNGDASALWAWLWWVSLERRMANTRAQSVHETNGMGTADSEQIATLFLPQGVGGSVDPDETTQDVS